MAPFSAVVWCLVLLCLVGSLVLNISLERTSELLHYGLEKAKKELNQSARKATTQTKMKPFDPFDPLNDNTLKDIAIVKNQAHPPVVKAPVKPVEKTGSSVIRQQYMVNWYNTPPYLKLRPDSLSCDFKPCEYNNCFMTFDIKNTSKADAVLFDGRYVFKKVGFERPRGQIWIFAAHESPACFMDHGGWWTRNPWKTAFNWTMTYDKTNTDIHLPYGGLLEKKTPPKRDFKEITLTKTNGILMINSNCPSRGQREDYVDELKRHYKPNITVLGSCGTHWHCGTHYVHDHCFNLLNTTYKFFLAFENAICRQYFSEKVFENFNYDIIVITRGGNKGKARQTFPKATIISTDDFKTIGGLASYLNKLSSSPNDYAALLKEKSKYYSPGYKYWYQRAMCEICERLNHQDKYRKHIPDITDWAYHDEPCKNATDIL